MSSTSDVISYLTLLLNVIDQKDWAAFQSVALANPKTFKSLTHIIATTDEFNGMTFLHACVRHDPPVQIIAEMIRICPDAPSCCDCLNRTPLHVAAGAGASVDVIKCLARAYPQACKIQDEDGRTPLHFACDSECQLFEEDDMALPRGPPLYEVVHALLSASIAPASLEDEDGITPLEYAIVSDADVKVVRLLQKAAQKHMKKMASAANEAKGAAIAA
jgi:hypothetical protein|eukprot:g14117.t1 g14117   contig9:1185866-1186519(-)